LWDEAEKESPLYIFGPAESCPILTRSLQDQQEAVKTLLSLASAAVTFMGYTDKKMEKYGYKSNFWNSKYGFNISIKH